MEKILEIILNPYCYIFLAALAIIGITQIIKLIPCFKDNNWNISFPVFFGYIAAFIWAILTKYEIQANIEVLLAFGAGIGALSSTLYGVMKKIFDKNYKAEKELENNEIYKFFNNILSKDVKDFNSKTILEKFNFVKDIINDVKRIVDNSKVENKEDLKAQINISLGRFLSTNTLSESIDNLMEIIDKTYKVPTRISIEDEKIEEINKGDNE